MRWLVVAMLLVGCEPSGTWHTQCHNADRVRLGAIVATAEQVYAETGRFPVAHIPLTPGTSCCEQNARGKRKCAANAADWATKDWQALDFAIDEDHFAQYSYDSDGTSFVARAVVDLDCDCVSIAWEARGAAIAGRVVVEFIDPPPNSD